MSVNYRLLGKECTGKEWADSFIKHFEHDMLELDIILRRINNIEVYDFCKICKRPVLRTDDYVTEGFLTNERLVHTKCKEKKYELDK